MKSGRFIYLLSIFLFFYFLNQGTMCNFDVRYLMIHHFIFCCSQLKHNLLFPCVQKTIYIYKSGAFPLHWVAILPKIYHVSFGVPHTKKRKKKIAAFADLISLSSWNSSLFKTLYNLAEIVLFFFFFLSFTNPNSTRD